MPLFKGRERQAHYARLPQELDQEVVSFLREGNRDAALRTFRESVSYLDPTSDDKQLRQEAISILMRNDPVEWNEWRESRQFIPINLDEFDFSTMPLKIAEDEAFPNLQMRALRGFDFREVSLNGAKLSRLAVLDVKLGASTNRREMDFRESTLARIEGASAVFDGSNFESAQLRECDFSYCELAWIDARHLESLACDFARSGFFDANLRSSQFADCGFAKSDDYGDHGAALIFSDLSDASFIGCNLAGALFDYSILKKTNFRGSDIGAAHFKKMVYRRRNLRGCFIDVENINNIEGDMISTQDIIDQAYFDLTKLDDREAEFKAQQRKKQLPGGSRWAERFTERLPRYPWLQNFEVSGLAWGTAWGTFSSLLVHDFNFSKLGLDLLLLPIIFGLLFSLAAGSYGRKAAFWAWELLDFGRDWDRVLVLAAAAIFFLGAGYVALAPSHLCFEASSKLVPTQGTCEPDAGELMSSAAASGAAIYPWYVAVMGFATLGITDLVRPMTAVGAIFLSINAFLGYTVLGLFLAVLQNSFMRRSRR